jgi:spore coat protein A
VAAASSADTVEIQAAKDNTLYEAPDGDLSNGAGRYFFAGRSLQGPGLDRKRGVIAFDVASAIPAGSTIDAATLRLRMSRSAQAGSASVAVHRLLADWGEAGSEAPGAGGSGAPVEPGDATWLHRFYPGVFWASPGGDSVDSASASTTIGTTETFYTWSSAQLAADVQGWLDAPSTNFGWVVIGDESTAPTAKRFDSREANQADRRPRLIVEYTPPTLLGACCDAQGGCTILLADDCLATGGTFQGAGTTCSPDPCAEPQGACCFGDGTCLEVSAADCPAQGGLYQGDGTDCSPNPCPQPTGACCLADGTCLELSAGDCAAAGGTHQGDGTACEPCLCPVVLEKYVDALPIPAVLAPTSGTPGGAASYEITMSQVSQQLHRDLPPTTVWGYAGSFPGPTIEASVGEPVTVAWINDLPATHALPVDTCVHGAMDDTSRAVVHLHGGHVPAAFDGYPEDTIAPGGWAVYEYPNLQLPATLWYHDHALGITRLNVYMGLAGFYLLRDETEQKLGLPSGEYEIALVIQDRSFNPDGSWCYPALWEEDFFGNTILVNGKVWPYLSVDRGTYRFRILNGSNSRVYLLSLSDGTPFVQIGAEGGLFESPVTMPQIILAPGERADVVVVFSNHAPATEVLLVNSAPAPWPGQPGVGVIPEIMKFVVSADAGPVVTVPPALRPLEILQESDAVRTRDMVLRKQPDPCTGSTWLIDDLGWDVISEFPRLGHTEVWSFINRSGMMHPMHLHLVMFQVLDRQDFEVVGDQIVPVGKPLPPDPNEAGWKDTVRAEPGQITRLVTRFEDYTGLFPYHCHILEHEDHEMMRQFQALPACPWDVDHDDVVGINDLLDLLAAWGTDPGGPPDVDGDGNVGINDLLDLLAHWGACP